MIRIPTLSELYNQIVADFESELGESIPLFGKSFLRATAAVQAAKLWINYKINAFVQKNSWVDTADPESMGGSLERFGRVKLNRNPYPATAGQYVVTVTGSIGAIIPTRTIFKSNDNALNAGKLFILDNQYTLVAVSDSITLRALEIGIDSRLNIGNQLTSTTPISLVNSLAVVSSEAVEPFSSEDIEVYRRKIIESFQLEPQGGSSSDYRLWANEVQGVAQSYPFAVSGQVGQVNLFIEATIEDSTDGQGSASAGLLDDVKDNIELPISGVPARKPVGNIVNYLSVTPLEVNINVAGFQGLTTDIENLILGALTEEIVKIRPFVSAIDIVSKRNDTLNTNKIITTILTTIPGSVFGTITLEVDSVATASKTFAGGEIPFLNSVTYV
jgi:uncharacterized phage protein gp47/JayE